MKTNLNKTPKRMNDNNYGKSFKSILGNPNNSKAKIKTSVKKNSSPTLNSRNLKKNESEKEVIIDQLEVNDIAERKTIQSFKLESIPEDNLFLKTLPLYFDDEMLYFNGNGYFKWYEKQIKGYYFKYFNSIFFILDDIKMIGEQKLPNGKVFI